MKEKFTGITRSALLLSLPLYAASCESGDKTTPPPREQKTPIGFQENTLTAHHRELLEIAKSTNGGVVFLNINNYNPQDKLFLQVTQLNPQTQQTLVSGRTEIQDKNKTGETIEAGIIIDNCSNAFVLEISTDGEVFDKLTYTNPDTGITSEVLQLDQNLCYTIMPVDVNR